jgi:hypothetical protein
LADFEQKKLNTGPNFRKFCYLPPILSNSRKVKEILFFFHSHRQNSVFLKPKCPQKGKVLWRPNFAAGLAGEFCQELATLSLLEIREPVEQF